MFKTSKSQKKSFKRQLNKNLVEKAEKGAFKPSVQSCIYWFHKLNHLLFNGKLGRVHIEVRKLHHDWGRCVADWDARKTPKGRFNQRIIPYHIPVQYYIQLHSKFPNWRDFIETLAHEMVHLYQMSIIKDPYSNHNANFYAFHNKFKRVGFSLHR